MVIACSLLIQFGTVWNNWLVFVEMMIMVIFEVDVNVSRADVERVKTEVRRSMSVIQSVTCVRFVETNQNAQLIFYTSSRFRLLTE